MRNTSWLLWLMAAAGLLLAMRYMAQKPAAADVRSVATPGLSYMANLDQFVPQTGTGTTQTQGQGTLSIPQVYSSNPFVMPMLGHGAATGKASLL